MVVSSRFKMAQYVESALDLKLKWLERGVGLYLETPRLKVYDDMKSVNVGHNEPTHPSPSL